MDRPRMLLVDDERPFLEVLTERLTSREFEVLACESGPEALRVLGEGRGVDVAVVDVIMPGMSGVETLREIKRRFPQVEVIMLTGQATVRTGIEGMRLGAFDYLEKPCDLGQLVLKVNEAKARRDRRMKRRGRSERRDIGSRD